MPFVPNPPVVSTDLITLAELRTAMRTPATDTSMDEQFTQWISYASDFFRTYTNRDFGLPTVTETRSFEYDGSGFLDIDDATAITVVAFTYVASPTVTIPTDQWRAEPRGRSGLAPVYQFILIPGYAGPTVYGDPAMGFTYNLDVYAAEHPYFGLPQLVDVTGTWGWPAIPGALKQAMIWTMVEWHSRESGGDLTAESIEGYSRAWGRSASLPNTTLAIPSRAMDILAMYVKWDA